LAKRTTLLALLLLAVPAGIHAIDEPRASVPEPRSLAAIPVSLVVDGGSNQVLHANRAELRFVPASVTKVMTTYVAFELIAQGKLKSEQPFAMSPQAFADWHGKGTNLGLNAGDSVPVDALLRAITTVSANDAAVVLAEGAAGSVAGWSALMNAEAKRLGMTNSRFATPNGWPDGGATFVSAADLAKLGEALTTRHPDLYRRYFGQKELTWNGVTQQNRDPTLGVVAGADGIKTGHTNEAGFNFLGSAERGGRRIFVAVAGARSEAERALASREAMEWAFAAFESKPLFGAGAQIGEARVQGGDSRWVGLIAPRGISYVQPTGGGDAAKLRIVYRGPLFAPIAKGQPVAELDVSVPGFAPARVALTAAEAIGEAGPLDRLWNGLMGLVS
jgi:serine-type D-Ala-D-Ala carboxypeptidase (penicillin-binding protein 5/6)